MFIASDEEAESMLAGLGHGKVAGKHANQGGEAEKGGDVYYLPNSWCGTPPQSVEVLMCAAVAAPQGGAVKFMTPNEKDGDTVPDSNGLGGHRLCKIIP